jgi:hypothetical protein
MGKVLPYSPDLEAFTVGYLRQTTKNNRPTTSKHYTAACHVLHLYARHVAGTEIEGNFKAYVKQLDPIKMSGLATPSALAATLRKLDPSISPSAAESIGAFLPRTPEDMKASLHRLQRHGMSGTYRRVAKNMRGFARSLPVHEEPSEFSLSRRKPRAKEICWLKPTPTFCSDFAAAIADTALLLTVVTLACAIGTFFSAGAMAAPCAFLLGADLSGLAPTAVIAAATAIYLALGCPVSGLGLTPG